jgi:hypothetical protein
VDEITMDIRKIGSENGRWMEHITEKEQLSE